MGSPTISRANALTAGENAGGTYIDMRNLGTQRTLVLVNGKRLGISTSGYQDISTLPVSAVERIEVLKDGASAIYGSDAMAGVVNIITRSNVTGVTANVYHGQYSQGDGARDRFDVVAGWSNERVSLTLSAEHAEEKGVGARSRLQQVRHDRSPSLRQQQLDHDQPVRPVHGSARPGLYRHCGLRLFPQPRRGSHQPGQLPPHRYNAFHR